MSPTHSDDSDSDQSAATATQLRLRAGSTHSASSSISLSSGSASRFRHSASRSHSPHLPATENSLSDGPIPHTFPPSTVSTHDTAAGSRRTGSAPVASTAKQRFLLSALSGAAFAALLPVVVLGTKGSISASIQTAILTALGTMSARITEESIHVNMSATGTTHRLRGSDWDIQRDVWEKISVYATAAAVAYSNYRIVLDDNGSLTTAISAGAVSPCGIIMANALIDLLGRGVPADVT
ncbi:hypothetical protein BCR39DRAFT_600273 [Naematelia encephala]|uniref:Uncharacterized protein n=1 Tax=Naematelia encephala TaxID=71784 RepID=A0A1Y2AR82_9TREE|nr:hypothetical protein BCR39DRAFT_600273 [Naematelia encephala]